MLNNMLQYCMKKYDDIQQAIKGLIDSKGQADGIAPLDENGMVPTTHLPCPTMVGVSARDDQTYNGTVDYGMMVDGNGTVEIYGNPECGGVYVRSDVAFNGDLVIVTGDMDMAQSGKIVNLPYPVNQDDAATFMTVVDHINMRLPQVFTVTIPITNAGVTGSFACTFPSCTANETDCIVDAAPAAASWDAFYDCGFRLKSISPTGFTYIVDSNLTSAMTVYITVQDITPIEIGSGEGGYN